MSAVPGHALLDEVLHHPVGVVAELQLLPPHRLPQPLLLELALQLLVRSLYLGKLCRVVPVQPGQLCVPSYLLCISSYL